jgi:hypothetical protein
MPGPGYNQDDYDLEKGYVKLIPEVSTHSGMSMVEEMEMGDDGKMKELDEFGNPIEHGFLGPRRKDYIW